MPRVQWPRIRGTQWHAQLSNMTTINGVENQTFTKRKIGILILKEGLRTRYQAPQKNALKIVIIILVLRLLN
jgi:hypothetical protein